MQMGTAEAAVCSSRTALVQAALGYQITPDCTLCMSDVCRLPATDKDDGGQGRQGLGWADIDVKDSR